MSKVVHKSTLYRNVFGRLVNSFAPLCKYRRNGIIVRGLIRSYYWKDVTCKRCKAMRNK